MKNLRVRDNTAEMVLIDFACAKPEAPVSYDAAELEISLAFGKPAPGERPLARQQLNQLYRDRLLATRPAARNAHPRRLAIEQIRRQIGALVSEEEYRAVVAVHCLYYAKKGCGAAYQIADHLAPRAQSA